MIPLQIYSLLFKKIHLYNVYGVLCNDTICKFKDEQDIIRNLEIKLPMINLQPLSKFRPYIFFKNFSEMKEL